MGNITGGPFISEIHYDQAGADNSTEFLEVCAPNGFDMTGFVLSIYNGSNGEVLNSFDLSTITACDGGDGNDYYVLEPSSIQNGTEGFALSNSAGVCEFISYEGVFNAIEGPAIGLTSMDIGVSENGATPGTSMQIQGPGGGWLTGITGTPKLPNICFLEGTRILTKDGYKNIENLTTKDSVITHKGEQVTIKWVGIQTIDPTASTNPLTTNPVKIKASALGNYVPFRDLTVSPNHAVFVDDLLINAGALINDINIIQLSPSNDFKYYHIELDSHELIDAEGAWSESYLPQRENRDAFDNAGEYDQEYPHGRNVILWPLKYARISAKNKVPEYIAEKILPNIGKKKLA